MSGWVGGLWVGQVFENSLEFRVEVARVDS